MPCAAASARFAPGDTPIMWKLDRLGRSLRVPITMLDDLRARAA
jgi:DNA invertase Pin-like site-specific DNA recombinase